MTRARILVFTTCYNERENIGDMVDQISTYNPGVDILVVDDNSSDGTWEILESKKQQYDNLYTIKRPRKLGIGSAHKYAIFYAIRENYETLVTLDADFSHNPKDLIRLHDACLKGADVAIGSRYVKGGGVRNWPKNRLLLSYGASLYVRIITWMNVKDPTAGFICYKRKVLESIDFNKIKFIWSSKNI